MRGNQDLTHIRGMGEKILPPSLRGKPQAVEGRIAKLAKAIRGPLLTPYEVWALLVRGQTERVSGGDTFQQRLTTSVTFAGKERFDADYCRQFLALETPNLRMTKVLAEMFGTCKAATMTMGTHRAHCFAAGYIARFEHTEEAIAQVAFYRDWLEYKARP